MKYGILLVCFILGTARAQEQEGECDEEDLQVCTTELQRLDVVDDIYNDTELCTVRVEIERCFKNYRKVCTTVEGEIIEDFQELEEKITTTCDGETNEDSQEVREAMQCLQEVELIAKSITHHCSDLVLAAVMSAIETRNNAEPISKNEIQCMVFHNMMECFLELVGKHCAAEVVQAVDDGVKEELKHVSEACERGEDIEPLLSSLD